MIILFGTPCTEVHISEVYASQEEVMDISTLIVKGKINDSRVEKTHIDGPDSHEWVFTIWTLEPNKTYKGEDLQYVDFKTIGGSPCYGIRTSGFPHFNVGDEVLVMLDSSPDSIYGDDYHLVSILSGAYLITYGKAVNAEKIEINEGDLEIKIKSHLGIQ